MTPQQIENWRKALSGRFGVYAFIMDEKLIEQHRYFLQSQVDQIASKQEERQRQSDKGVWTCPNGHEVSVSQKDCLKCKVGL